MHHHCDLLTFFGGLHVHGGIPFSCLVDRTRPHDHSWHGQRRSLGQPRQNRISFFRRIHGGGSLGNRLISPNTGNPFERRILNVVEEMAIASGTPVPPVYLMEEEGINAFAAGFAPRDAVIGITRGCATKLTRDQLQGVVAHEFSHILNGDMRINIRLTGVLFGIVFLARIGEIMLYAGRGSSHRRRSKDDGGGAFVMIGIGLVVIGLIGGFFGSLIRAAVSRQGNSLPMPQPFNLPATRMASRARFKRIGGFSCGSNIGVAGQRFFPHVLRLGHEQHVRHPPSAPRRDPANRPKLEKHLSEYRRDQRAGHRVFRVIRCIRFSSGQQAATLSPQSTPNRDPERKASPPGPS